VTALAKRNAHIWAPAARDCYVEPEWCSRRLFEAEPFVGEIVDPACGTGRIVTAARAYGHCATGFDLATGNDFLLKTRPFSNVVSNPPYSIFREFAEHALRLARHKVALVFPLARVVAARWLEQTPLARIYLLTPRPSMPPGDVILRGEKPQGGRVDFCWLVWSHGHNGGAGCDGFTATPPRRSAPMSESRQIFVSDGSLFDPTNATPESIPSIECLASPSSFICRWGAQVRRFYSLAEHACHVHDAASAPNKLAALLHDASEALGLADICSPVKRRLPEYRRCEDALMAAVAARFGFPWPVPAEIHDLDVRIRSDELAQAMVQSPDVVRVLAAMPPGLGITLQFWDPPRACAEFLERFHAITGPAHLRDQLRQWKQLPRSRTIKRIAGEH
jgi:hypothetical protein